MLAPDFIQILREQLTEAFPAFEQSFNLPAPTSIYFNFLKSKSYKENYNGVKWCNNGVYLSKRPVFTLDPAFHAAAYVEQEAASMFLAEAIRQYCNTTRPIRALDISAGSGAHSPLLAATLAPKSFIVCNEANKNKHKYLKEKLNKWGYPNVHISNHNSDDFKGLKHFFELAIVNAPSSKEGVFRKNKKAALAWSKELIASCAAQQKHILAQAANALKEGGILIYSVSAYNDAETIENAAFLIKEFDFEVVPLKIREDWRIVAKKYGYQFYPHRTESEGFYLACFRKKIPQTQWQSSMFRATSFSLKKLPKKQMPLVEKWLEEPQVFSFFVKQTGLVIAVFKTHVSDCVLLDQKLQHKDFGLEVGIFKRDVFIPSAALAMSTAIKKDWQAVQLNKTQALQYLKKEDLNLTAIPQGWVLAQYEGLNLGWLKKTNHKINNYYPKDWQIRMNVVR